MALYRQILHAIDNHGVRGLFLRAFRKLGGRTSTADSFSDSPPIHPFDQRHSVDTSGYVPGGELGGGSSSDLYTTAYYGISPSTLTRAIEMLPEPADGYTFADLGCGKGRALLVAAQFAFTRILGVELSASLCEIARINAASDPRIEVRQGDGATAMWPEGPLVLYMYHPFLAPLLRRMLANLERQRRDFPDATYLLYANCRYEKVMAAFPALQQVWDYSIPLSAEDAAVDRHGTTQERFTLYRLQC